MLSSWLLYNPNVNFPFSSYHLSSFSTAYPTVDDGFTSATPNPSSHQKKNNNKKTESEKLNKINTNINSFPADDDIWGNYLDKYKCKFLMQINPYFCTCTPWKRQKTFTFLTFSEGTEM